VSREVTPFLSFFLSFFGYFTTLSVLGLYSIGDKVLNKYEAVGAMKISTWCY
jgi:hypothetical protein